MLLSSRFGSKKIITGTLSHCLGADNGRYATLTGAPRYALGRIVIERTGQPGPRLPARPGSASSPKRSVSDIGEADPRDTARPTGSSLDLRGTRAPLECPGAQTPRRIGRLHPTKQIVLIVGIGI